MDEEQEDAEGLKNRALARLESQGKEQMEGPWQPGPAGGPYGAQRDL